MIKTIFFIGVICIFQKLACQVQPVHQFRDSVAQYNFTKGLKQQGLYDAAASELERLVYQHPNNIEYLYELFETYKISGKPDMIKEHLLRLQNIDKKLIYTLYQSYVKVNDVKNSRQIFESSLVKNINEKNKNDINFSQLLLEYKPEEASILMRNIATDQLDVRLQNLFTLHQNTKYKSPIVAGLLSAVLPTAGRHYARDHKDAIFSLIFMGTSAFQAYRRFSQNGINSPSGWAYTVIFGGFYTANIYGSVKAAVRYNKLKYQNVYNGAKGFIDLYYID